MFIIEIINNRNSKIVIAKNNISLAAGEDRTGISDNKIIAILSAVAAVVKKKKLTGSMPTNEEIAVIKAAIRHYYSTNQIKITVRPPVASMWKIAARLRM